MNLSRTLSACFGVRSVGERRAGGRSMRSLEQLELRLNLSAVLVVETADSYWLIEEPNFGLPLADASDAVTDASDCNDWYFGWNQSAYDETGSSFLADDETLASLLSAVSTDTVLTDAESQQMSDMLSELLVYGDFAPKDIWSISLVSNSTIDDLETSGYFDDSFEPDSLFANDFFSSDSESFSTADNNESTSSDASELEVTANRNDSLSTSDESESVLTGAAGSDVIVAPRFEPVDQQGVSSEFNSPANATTSSKGLADRATLSLPTELANLVQRDRSQNLNTVTSASDMIATPANCHQHPRAGKNAAANVEADKLNVDQLFARFQSETLELTSLSGAVHYFKAVRGVASSDDAASGDVIGENSGWSYAQMASLVGTISLTLASWHQRTDRDRSEDAVLLKNRPLRKEAAAC